MALVRRVDCSSIAMLMMLCLEVRWLLRVGTVGATLMSFVDIYVIVWLVVVSLRWCRKFRWCSSVSCDSAHVVVMMGSASVGICANALGSCSMVFLCSSSGGAVVVRVSSVSSFASRSG